MAATNFGWAGTVNETQFARINQLTQPQDYAKLTLTDWTVTPVANTRAVSVSPGTGGGLGLWTATDSAEGLAIATTPTNGQWFLLVRNRVWGTKLSGLVFRPHTETAVGTAGATPSTFPAAVKTNPGVEDDVPIAWVWANSANTNLTIVPILRPTRILPRRGTAAQRDAFYGVPGSNVSLQAGLAYAEWFNTDSEWQEVYLPARANSGGVDIDRPAGWYPIWGALPFLEADNNGANQNIPDSTETLLALSRITARGGFTSGSGLFTVPFAGRYSAHAVGTWASSSAGGLRQFSALVNGSVFSYSNVRNPPTLSIAADGGFPTLAIPAAGTIGFSAYQNTGATLAFNTRRHSLAYVGPI